MSPDVRAAQAVRPRRSAARVAVVLSTLLIGLAAACTIPPPTPTPDAYGFRVALGDGAMVLSWHAPEGTDPESYDIQVITAEDPTWSDLLTTPDTSATLTGLENGVRYTYRVRSSAAPGVAPGAWSKSIPRYYFELNLPIIRIDTENDAPILDKENYVPGSVTLDPNGSAYAPYSGTLGIRGRGNSTWKYPKKPYRMKLDTKSSLMGMPAERDWVLLANFVDQSQLRSWVAGQASNATDLAFTPTYDRFVEVVLNGDYLGVYQLTQHMELGSDRIDITEMEDTDNQGVELTGGYRLEIDGRLEENNEPGFRTQKNVPVVVKDPDPMTAQQRNYIRSYVQQFENTLFGENMADPVDGYRKYLDLHSFIDYYLVQELTRNQDVYWSSTYFTKERGEDQFRFGPIWDFDRSMGTEKGVVPQPPDGWHARTKGAWTRQIFRDDTMLPELADRWNELKPSFDAIVPQIVPLGQSLRPAIESDATRWGYSMLESDSPEFLRQWLTERIAWMDSQFNSPA